MLYIRIMKRDAADSLSSLRIPLWLTSFDFEKFISKLQLLKSLLHSENDHWVFMILVGSMTLLSQ